MKIGILTFHWATNYGAVLQAYALQTYLESIGHEAMIVDYKPLIYDINLKNFIFQRQWKDIKAFNELRKKERDIVSFRSKYLHLTRRFITIKELDGRLDSFDVIISGSDQVLNPYFLKGGEGKGVITPSYFLGFSFTGKRVGYAVSFGVTQYPSAETEIAKHYINNFNSIGTREISGAKIIETMGRNDAVVVPDPTILLAPAYYRSLADTSTIKTVADTYCFFIRHISERKPVICSLQLSRSMLWNNEDDKYSIEDWLAKIKNTKFVITDSFHCVVMCLKLHTPFAVVTELKGNTGMNDRLYTLLGVLGLEERIIDKNNLAGIPKIYNTHLDWDKIDGRILEYRKIGVAFLNCI